ncbi:MAG: translesion error-prone DNA polymerase V autoproteolytic subunit [Alistipes sp.]|jgi:DNA polymerase V|nr:translesion error-prone DNA polymerase V autoproteolytic subunit [Alistipes sp.]MBQ1957996.1 translesion error-prone DNA polymerase V autoproteolytic subunit [Alistipes sp.]MBQ1981552.1 translesion error-prone DNA polymerase V autoproteolytic subunit [Alistipes sp.]MBQ2416524.1 translesion error-prone DNA polymerase V autoproteolytic subunit [Alistipes sp.]MBQ5622803.1 translesion error-prone DNA polymerase V autoproteolytic subunit [Alistipes sp.]
MAVLEQFQIEYNSQEIELCGDVKAGFPSPADDTPHEKLDLMRLVVRHPASTFYFRISGVSMVDDGFDEGDIVVVDRSLEPTNNSTAVCFIDGEFTIKKIRQEKDCLYLMPANKEYKPIKVTAENEFMVWGVVTYIIKKVL